MKYTQEFRTEVIDFAKQFGVIQACKKYSKIVYPDTIKRWIDPKAAEEARIKSAEFHNQHKNDNCYKEKRRHSANKRRKSEKGIQYMQNYIETNKEQIKENIQRHRQENLEHYKRKSKEWYEKNKERAKQCRKGNYQKNCKKYAKLQLERYHNDPITKLKHLTRNRVNQLLKQGKILKKNQSALLLLGCTIDELKIHLEQQFKPGMSWNNHGDWHIDHKTPLVSFDLTDIEQQKQAFCYKNLQPLWKKENLQKATKILLR